MASSSAWEGLGYAATVAQLVGVDAVGLVSMIRVAAETARQNKRECDHLADRVNMIAELLPRVQEQELDPAAMRPLAGLGSTLREAHELVMACQGKGWTYRFFNAGRQAERFRDVQARIDSYLSVFPIISHIGIVRRLDGTPADNNNVPLRSRSDVLEPAAVVGEEFTVAEIKAATDNFAVVLLGEGGDSSSGATVYMGRLRDGRQVAVKRVGGNGLRRTRRREEEDAFGMELAVLSPLRHDHIIRLLGWCTEDDARLLVYDYRHWEKGTLQDHLRPVMSSSSLSPVTTSWKTRVKVLLGVARAIEHLHCRAVPLIIHRNITSSNVLLDATWTPRVSGFAASVWRAPPETGKQMVDVVGDGAEGYTDPEHHSSGHLKPASDVYSLGVVMLEVLTGKPPVVKVSWEETTSRIVTMSLVSWALPSIESGKLRDVLDRRPTSTPTRRRLQALELVANTAARCLLLHGDNRPAMSDVVANLKAAVDLMFNT